MPPIIKFEEIESWKMARELYKEVVKLTKRKDFDRDYDFKRHIRKTVESIMNNISEGFERDGNKEFIQFLYIAKGSSGEFRSQLYIALDMEYIDKKEFEIMYETASAISSKLNGLIKYLKNSGYKGRKFANVERGTWNVEQK